MENKKSFVLYSDLIHTVEKLPDDKAGQLFKTILEYVNDNDPVIDDLIVSISFEPIKQQLKRDLERWANIKEDRSKAGKASAEARRIKKLEESTNPTHVDSVEQDSTNPTVSVNETVTVTVNDRKESISARKLTFKESLFSYVGDYKKETVKAFFEYWSEHGDNDKKMRFEKEKSFGVSRRLSTWAKNDFDKTENQSELKSKNAHLFMS